MTKEPDNLFVPADGQFYIGPTTALAPTDAITPPDADFVDMGGFDRNNLGLTPGREETDYRFFGSFYPDLTTVTARTKQLTITLAETTAEALMQAFDGGTVTPGSGPDEWIYDPPDPREIAEKALILDLFYGDKIRRWYYRRAKVSAVDQIVLQNENPMLLPLTWSILNPGGGLGPFRVFVSGDPDWGAGVGS